MTVKHEIFQIDGISVDIRNYIEASSFICDAAAMRRSLSVFTINLDHVVKLRKGGLFRAAYERAGLVLADGFPIVMAGRLQGRRLTRTTGADLIEPLCEEAARRGLAVAFYGSSFESLAGAARRLTARIPELQIAGVYAPPAGLDVLSEEAAEGLTYIRQSGAAICFVALGAPKQEIFADRCVQHDPGIAFICIGAGLDFLAGSQKRAPKLFQSTGLEWLWRLALAPKRLGHRYLACIRVLPSLFWTAAFARQ